MSGGVVGDGRNSTSRELARYIQRDKGGQGSGVNVLVKVSLIFKCVLNHAMELNLALRAFYFECLV